MLDLSLGDKRRILKLFLDLLLLLIGLIDQILGWNILILTNISVESSHVLLLALQVNREVLIITLLTKLDVSGSTLDNGSFFDRVKELSILLVNVSLQSILQSALSPRRQVIMSIKYSNNCS